MQQSMARIYRLVLILLCISTILNAQDSDPIIIQEKSTIEIPKDISSCSKFVILKINKNLSNLIEDSIDLKKIYSIDAIGFGYLENISTFVIDIPSTHEIEVIGTCSGDVVIRKNKKYIKKE